MNKFIVYVFLISVLIIQTAACNISAGSYPYVERYEFNTDEATLIEAIKIFKKNNIEYSVPISTQLSDGRSDSSDHWYSVYFYYAKEDKIVYAWTRPINKEKTSFALVGINSGLKLGNWREVNKDFNAIENQQQKKMFEDRIVKSIREILNTR